MLGRGVGWVWCGGDFRAWDVRVRGRPMKRQEHVRLIFLPIIFLPLPCWCFSSSSCFLSHGARPCDSEDCVFPNREARSGAATARLRHEDYAVRARRYHAPRYRQQWSNLSHGVSLPFQNRVGTYGEGQWVTSTRLSVSLSQG